MYRYIYKCMYPSESVERKTQICMYMYIYMCGSRYIFKCMYPSERVEEQKTNK